MTKIYALGPFRLDTSNGLLFRDAEPLSLGRRAIALLQTLVERPGALVSKDTLIESAWSGQAVEDSNLTVQIAALRRVLGEAPGGNRWIETMPRRGYRFVGPGVAIEENGVTAPPSQVDISREAPPITYRATRTREQVDIPWETAPVAPSDAERRQITILSSELVGVAAGAGRMDLEDLRDAVGSFRRCVSEMADRHSGTIHGHLGNKALVLFGYPKAHEDDAERAVRAGLELCAAVRALSPDEDAPMRCRVGIATGMVIIGDHLDAGAPRDQGIVGEVPSTATRLLISVLPGAVAIDPATRRLIGELFDCRDLGEIETDAAAEPLRHWRVMTESHIASRFEALRGANLSRLVGRDEEIDLLLRRWTRAKAGDGQIVLLSGEAGIGKSRLAAALEERLHAEPHLRLRFFCSPHHQDSPLFPFIEQLGRAAGFARDETAATRMEKLEGMLAGVMPLDEDVVLLADLLSLQASTSYSLANLNPRQKKQRTFGALLRQLEGLVHQHPILMVFEDAHWIDPTSRELLDLTVERLCTLPVLLIVTFRPEFEPPWTGQPQVTMLTLNRLDRRDRCVLVQQVAGGKELPEEVVTQIADRTDGVPLFVEELTKGVLESGVLRESAERYVLDRALPAFAIPTTLHDSLMERLDRLAPVRRLAQIGAAIGRQFSYALLHAVARLPEDELQASLARLVASELVFQRGTPPDAVYSFKHALVTDAAHGSLLRDARRQLHAQIADALEAHFPEVMENQPELLAQHYAEAGLVERALACWGRAGHKSAARSAMTEAAVQFQKGLDQLALLPDSPERRRHELEFLSALGAALQAAKGQAAPETGQAYSRARELWGQLGFPSEFLHIPYGQSRYHLHRGELDLALRLDEDLLRVSRQRNDIAGLALGHISFGRDMLVAGKFVSSRSHLNEVFALYDPISHRSPIHQDGIHHHIESQAFLGVVLFCLGYPDQGLAQSNAAVAEARRLAQPVSLALSLAANARLFSLAGEIGTLDERVEELFAVATEQGFPVWRAFGIIYCGWVKTKNGETAAGISLLRGGLDAYRVTGAELLMPHHIGLLARAYEAAGQIEEALIQLDDALQIVERTGERFLEAEFYRHKGELLLRQGHTEVAEVLYHKALSIARNQEAKLWELRVAVSLARLWHDQGRYGQARDLLAPVYGWFTEGFATPDLKEARALLRELI